MADSRLKEVTVTAAAAVELEVVGSGDAIRITSLDGAGIVAISLGDPPANIGGASGTPTAAVTTTGTDGQYWLGSAAGSDKLIHFSVKGKRKISMRATADTRVSVELI